MKVFLDLDLTLVNSIYAKKHEDTENRVHVGFGIYTKVRPNALYFIHELINDGHEVEIITYADLEYAKSVVEKFKFPINKITSMRELNAPLNYKNKDWVLVDDLPARDKIKHICGNEDAEEHLIRIHGFFCNNKDNELLKILSIIRFISTEINPIKYRRFEERYWGLLEKESTTQEEFEELKIFENNSSIWGAIYDFSKEQT